MDEVELEEMMQCWGGSAGWIIDGEMYIAQKLMFHWALLINSTQYGHEQRYCYKDLALINTAMTEFMDSGKLRYWHKDHTKNISVVGSFTYQAGMLQEPEYAIGQVDWTVPVDSPHITCPQCKKSSYSSGDISNVFCIKCGYHRDLPKP